MTALLSREWFSCAELAAFALPEMPNTKANVIAMAARENWQRPEWENRHWRKRTGRGGGVEYRYDILPQAAQIKLVFALGRESEADASAQMTREELAAWYDKQPDKKKNVARERAKILDNIAALEASGESKTAIKTLMKQRCGVSMGTLYNWQALVAGVDRADWVYYLMPRHVGRTGGVECPPEVWDHIRSNYLRAGEPTVAQCYREAKEFAESKGLDIPSERTLERRLLAIDETTRVFWRQGRDALDRLYPAQERDYSMLHALWGVNGDGHKADVTVDWGDGWIGRPMIVVYQDLYSTKYLSWRVDKSENENLIRLAFGDLVERWGIPQYYLTDNGRAFAAKGMTGGAATRFRYKVKPDDPEGLLKQMSIDIHFATPHHGQSKKIERSFGDIARDIWRKAAFDGAYTGNSPENKPYNYGTKAVPLATFLAVLKAGIDSHNARLGRTGGNCNGRSFDQTFADSYATAPIVKATADQRRLWLLKSEAVTASSVDGVIRLQKNRYHADFLTNLRGDKVVCRYDPDNMQAPLHVYGLDGRYFGAADCIEKTGFADADAAQEFHRTKRQWLRAKKEIAAAERALKPSELAAMMTPVDAPEPPETRVIRPIFGTRGNAALAPQPIDDFEESAPANRLDGALALLSAARRARPGGGHLALVNLEEDI